MARRQAKSAGEPQALPADRLSAAGALHQRLCRTCLAILVSLPGVTLLVAWFLESSGATALGPILWGAIVGAEVALAPVAYLILKRTFQDVADRRFGLRSRR